MSVNTRILLSRETLVSVNITLSASMELQCVNLDMRPTLFSRYPTPLPGREYKALCQAIVIDQ